MILIYELQGLGRLRTRLEVSRTRGFSKFAVGTWLRRLDAPRFDNPVRAPTTEGGAPRWDLAPSTPGVTASAAERLQPAPHHAVEIIVRMRVKSL